MFEHLNRLKSYTPGRPIEEVVAQFGIKPEQVIKLASNENPIGPAPEVVEAIGKGASQVNRYPDDNYPLLKEGLALRFGVSPEEIIIGAGSDEVLKLAVEARAPKKILTAGVTFAMYQIFGEQVGAQILKTPSPTHKMEEFLELYRRERPELVFICTPNNPIGEALDRREVEWFLDGVDPETLVVIDGAYQEFAGYRDRRKVIPPSTLVERPNILYTGTFSKAYGLGGLRVGYGIGNRRVIEGLNKLRPPFNISTLSYIGAVEALRHWEWVANYLELNFREMERYQQLAEELGFQYQFSYTNFILIYFPNSKELYDHLFRRGIILRDMSSYGLSALRITIGRPEENDRVLEEIRNYYRRG